MGKNNTVQTTVKGYKVFNPDWTCRDFQYEVGKTYEMDALPECCNRGFHFCLKATDCFKYYNFDAQNKVAEVIALGDVDYGNDDTNTKCCTNRIQIVREISWHEVLDIVNTGNNCTGYGNSGYGNSGDYNSGNHNSGYGNSGDYNSGHHNSGNHNSGYHNSGNHNSGYGNSGDGNSGNYNSGHYNSGHYNSGDWNNTDFSSGCFNTVEQKIMLFNEPSDITYRDWIRSDARFLLNQIPKNVVEWISYYNMTDNEKAEHPSCETTKGYLKVLDESECGKLWWDGLFDYQKDIILNIPNFDPDIFEQCTGIKVDNIKNL